MARVSELQPGDVIPAPFGTPSSATFVARTQHPLYPALQLVVWRMDGGEWSHDALDERQEVGEPVDATADDRLYALRHALLGRPGSGDSR